jgi:cell division protein FtsQ
MPRFTLPKPDARAVKIGVAVATLGAAVTSGFWLYNSPVMSLHGVQVDGNIVVSDDVIRQVAELQGQSLVLPDFESAEERLRAFPLVKDADVTRDWPFGASVSVVEREAWGVWQAGDQRYVIDDEGIVITLPEPENAPIIIQTDVSQPLEPGSRVDASAVAVASELFATAELATGQSVSRLEYSEIAGLSAVLTGDVRVSFGGVDNYEFKLASLYAVLERAQEKGESVRVVDLRFGDRVAVE